MSPYEERRWAELQRHWARKAQVRQVLPSKARAALEAAGEKTKGAASTAVRAISNVTPEPVKERLELITDAALVTAAKGAVHLLELITDWTTEMMDPEQVLKHHRSAGRDVGSLADLKTLDLQDLDDYTRRMALKWRTGGALEGGVMGTLAIVPYGGGVAAIGLDMVAVHVLSTAIVTQICYAYGFDVNDDQMRHMVDRMVVRAYKEQAPKAATVRQANAAFAAGKGRIRWSDKLRDDHRLMAAVEKLMKQFANGRAVSVEKVTKVMPVIAIFAGAGTNAYVLGDVAHQARLYARTLFLAEKYGLPLPSNLLAADD
jgi:hypothetical protein